MSQDPHYYLPSTLNITNALNCLQEIRALKIPGKIWIDAHQVTHIDSAGMALLLELQTLQDIQLQNLSPSILKVAELYQLNLDH